MFQEFVRPDSPIPRQVPMPDFIRVRDLYLRVSRHAGGEKMTLGSRSAEGETSDLPVPLRMEAPESSTPMPAGRKRRLTKSSTTKPKISKGSSSTMPATRVVEETTTAPSAKSEQAIPNLSDFVEMFSPIQEEVKETEVLITSRRSRPVDPPTVEEPEALAMVVADMLGDFESEEVMESQPGVDGETGDAQSFAFDNRVEEEPPTEVQVEQLIEVTQVKVEPEAITSVVEEDVVEVASPRGVK